jgi:hypothetical protein
MDDFTVEAPGEDFAVEVTDLPHASTYRQRRRGIPLWRVRTALERRLTPRQRLGRLGSAAAGVLVVLLVIVGSSPALRDGATALLSGGSLPPNGSSPIAEVPDYGPELLLFWPIVAFCCALLLVVEALALHYIARGPEYPPWRRRAPLVPLAGALWSLWLALHAYVQYWQLTRALALGGDTSALLALYQGMQLLPAQGLLTLGATYLLVMAGFGALALDHSRRRPAAAESR